jgi:hypothetical protein
MNTSGTSEEKMYKHLTELTEWKKNPRTISREGLDNLKAKLTKYGQLDPLLIIEDGTVIGGNMRLRAMYELGWKKAWVTVAHPKTEKEKIEMALAHNDHDGRYIEGDLETLLVDFNPEELSSFSVFLGEPTSLEDILGTNIPPEISAEILTPYKKTHVLISFDPNLMDKISPLLEQIKATGGIEYETGSN